MYLARRQHQTARAPRLTYVTRDWRNASCLGGLGGLTSTGQDRLALGGSFTFTTLAALEGVGGRSSGLNHCVPAMISKPEDQH